MSQKNKNQNDFEGSITPMIQQYLNIKKDYTDSILMYRMGDFYEMFFEDAKTAAKELDIVLTTRGKDRGQPIPLAGIPYHALDSYLSRLIRKGYKIAICEQVEDPKKAKGIVARDVVRVVTPGTILEENILDEKTGSYILSLYLNTEQTMMGIAYIDISTGDFRITQIPVDNNLNQILSELNRISPREILLPENLYREYKARSSEIIMQIDNFFSPFFSSGEEWTFELNNSEFQIKRMFNVSTTEGFGIRDLPLGICAAGGLLKYLEDTQKQVLKHIKKIARYNLSQFMFIDIYTQTNLELTRTISEGKKKNSLLWVLDHTKTPMGGRLLKEWTERPLLDTDEIRRRQSAISEFLEHPSALRDVQEKLSDISDVERIIGRLSANLAFPKDLIALKNSLKNLPDIVSALENLNAEFFKRSYEKISPVLTSVEGIHSLIDRAIMEPPANILREGGIFKNGYSEELDDLRKIAKGGREYLKDLEDRERKRTGINKLRVSFNKVFGYFIEITKAQSENVPDDYIRKQTLVNTERFFTQELKEFEDKVLGAQERINELEFELFIKLREELIKEIEIIQEVSRFYSETDVIQSLAQAAKSNNYTRPRVTQNSEITIKDGRHPVVEIQNLGEPFIPNDIKLNDEEQILIITGPNMAGKSTYLRQTALLVLMAQMGSFIPAADAEIGMVDRIFTRIGAADNIVMGQSTFMVEMTETANILNNATNKSLIILDEIGRGTSTFDGLSIAWAIVEYLHEKSNVRAKTLFATHYHELTELELTLTRVKNYNILVKEWNDKIRFLRKVVPGNADKSYGIQVAKLAGIPEEVIERAKEVLQNLEEENFDINGKPVLAKSKNKKTDDSQPSLFSFNFNDPLRKKLKGLDLNNVTPIKALEILNEIKKDVQNE
mgnify:CR=1 FL=1